MRLTSLPAGNGQLLGNARVVASTLQACAPRIANFRPPQLACRTMNSRSLVTSLLIGLVPFSTPVPAKDLGWQPEKTWLFVVGVLSWKHSDIYGSFPVKNRRDNLLVDFFKDRGVPGSQIVYLKDKEATQERIDA